MAAEEKLGWDEFAAAIGGAANIAGSAIDRRSRLLEDLGLDSLALAEVVVLLLVDFNMTRLGVELGKRNWTLVTVGELYDEYQWDEPPPHRKEFVMRAPPQR